MYFFNLSVLVAASSILSLASAAPQCTAAKRIKPLAGVAPGFSDQRPGATAKFIQSLPLQDDATLTLYIDGAPGQEVAPDASTVRNFALGVRQFFYKVTGPRPTDYGNGTTFVPLDITTGVLHIIALPVDFYAGLVFNYDLKTCLIKTVVGYLTIPTKIGGVPVPTMQEELARLSAEAKAASA